MKQLVIFGIIVIFSVSAMAQNVGQIAPDFSLKSLSNNNYTLSENRGDVIVVFLVGYNCPLCLASAPTVKSDLFDVFSWHANLQLLIIDTWDGSYSGFQTFQTTTNLPGTYLQMGSGVAKSWSSTYDRLVVIDADGKMVFKGNASASSDVDNAKKAVQNAINVATAIDDLYLNHEFWAKQNFPNPFSDRTAIRFNLPESEAVSLSVTDLTGKEVVNSIFSKFPAGQNTITLNRNNLTGGIYFYHLKAGQHISSGKMIVR